MGCAKTRPVWGGHPGNRDNRTDSFSDKWTKASSFFILLAAYLFLWSFRKEGKLQEWYVKGSCLYSLAGVYIFAGSLTDNGVAVMMWVTAAYGAEYAVMCYRGQARTWFWATSI